MWPKVIPPLTKEQKIISDDFTQHWLHVSASKYKIADSFGHNFVISNTKQFVRTLEVGAGNGEHITYETLSEEQLSNYTACDIRLNVLAELEEKHPKINILCQDCQEGLPFEDNYFDRILAIHVLEHLPNLPAAIFELYRVCSKNDGQLFVVIPCEGSLAHRCARKISAERIFKNRYNQPYDWFIKREHINTPKEIFDELARYFEIQSTQFFPFNFLPFTFCNLVIGAVLSAKSSRKFK